MNDDEQSLGRNCQIRGDRGKTLKSAEVAFFDARENFRALTVF